MFDFWAMTQKIQRALISVSDKSGLVPFAKKLSDSGVALVSTGGTAKAIRDAGMEVTELSDYTGFPEMLDGRVKTLHPKVHGGLLYLRENEAHCETVSKHGIAPIDLVVVNLYPFEATIAKPDVTLVEAIENIDIGGPSMLRSAAKNHQSVTVIIDPADYEKVANQVSEQGGTTLELRRCLAAKVYARTAAYDATIANHLSKEFEKLASEDETSSKTPANIHVQVPKVQELRYGENPHQAAALYGHFNDYFQQLHGKALSYNNILDLTSAQSLISEFEGQLPTLAILKHTNPCGVGQGEQLAEAWEKAFATDRLAPFGGIIASNVPLDGPCAEAIAGIFSEVIIAPEFQPEALEILQKKKNLRLIKAKQSQISSGWQVRAVGAESYLAQAFDQKMVNESDLKVVTKRAPSDAELKAMLFGWRVVKHLKSNAIVYTGKDRTLGVGAGQMSRVDSSRIAVWKAGEAKLSLKGSVVCSDAFFPFADGLIAAAEAGATAAIQPGGSVRDEEVIAAANERDVAMVFTGNRHFRH
jgi:phosphoribosylaminoimidazolecarboxamide formyltransferase / IMP cyclohydrolase